VTATLPPDNRRCTRGRYRVLVLAASLLSLGIATGPNLSAGETSRYQVLDLRDAAASARTYTQQQTAILEKLNRADAAHLRRLRQLVVPLDWDENELSYSPFPIDFPAVGDAPRFLIVAQREQAFAAYEGGRLVKWGPVSSGRQAYPTPEGLVHLNWRSRGRHSTVNPNWYMEWYFNFHNTRGLALHAYDLPGRPASHACVRLLNRDAKWIFDWARGWTLDHAGRVVEPGTPLLIHGRYDFASPPPWISLDYLRRGITLPVVPGLTAVRPTL